jgi:hypothetical protein
MYTAVVSFHTNPYTCGVARFNLSLSRAMQLPLVQLDEYLARLQAGFVLLSIKVEEIQDEPLARLTKAIREGSCRYDLLIHGLSDSMAERELCQSARRIFAASAEMASTLRPNFPEVTAVFAPGAPVLPKKEPVDCTLLTFGMAHKIRSEGYQRLATLLEGDSRTFRLEISTALHEGGTFDESFFTVGNEISAAFSGNVRFLGFLTDAEVSERLVSVDALVAFFPRGVRENNTTVLSAMSHGCPVITNLDRFSPDWMRHGQTLFDVERLQEFPSRDDLRQVADAGKKVAKSYSFEHLARLITSPLE